MKKLIYFVLGVAVGIILTVVVGYIIGQKATGNEEPQKPAVLYGDRGISLFDEPGSVLPMKSFKVLQVLPNGTALAYSAEKATVDYMWQYGEPVVLLLPEDGMSYYDDMIIKVPSGKVARQIGTYRYETKKDFMKTVPIVGIQPK